MSRTEVRARLTLWHSGVLALLVSAFAIAGYVFLEHPELARTDSTLREQSEIVAQAMSLAAAGGTISRADTTRLLSVMHDLRARGLRAWVFDAGGHPILTTDMVEEGEGAAEARRVLGDTRPTSALLAAGVGVRGGIVRRTIASGTARARLFGVPLATALGGGAIVVSSSLRDLDNLLAHARDAAIAAVIIAVLLSALAASGSSHRRGTAAQRPSGCRACTTTRIGQATSCSAPASGRSAGSRSCATPTGTRTTSSIGHCSARWSRRCRTVERR